MRAIARTPPVALAHARNRHAILGLELVVSHGGLHVNTLLQGVLHFRFEAAKSYCMPLTDLLSLRWFDAIVRLHPDGHCMLSSWWSVKLLRAGRADY
jgi:hypothetical protein